MSVYTVVLNVTVVAVQIGLTLDNILVRAALRKSDFHRTTDFPEPVEGSCTRSYEIDRGRWMLGIRVLNHGQEHDRGISLHITYGVHGQFRLRIKREVLMN